MHLGNSSLSELVSNLKFYASINPVLNELVVIKQMLANMSGILPLKVAG